jgi:hypothetical protein
MGVNMEEADCPIKFQFGREMMADPVIEVHPVLACNVVVQSQTLLWMHISCPNGFQQGPIDILLLFSAIQIHNAVRSEAAMPQFL